MVGQGDFWWQGLAMGREVGEVGGGGAVELAAVLEVEEAVGLGQVADGGDEGLAGLGVEEGDYAP